MKQEKKDNAVESYIPNSSLFNKSLSYQPTKRKDPIQDQEIDFKNIELLKEYLTESNKIISSHVTGVKRKKQSQLTIAIKRAQKLALLSCC